MCKRLLSRLNRMRKKEKKQLVSYEVFLKVDIKTLCTSSAVALVPSIALVLNYIKE